MKKMLAWILCLGMLLCMAACGEKTPETDLKPSESHTEEPTPPETTSPSTPAPTEPTQPEATDPTSTEPAATEPAPTEPAPTEPAPTEPTEPAPTEPTQPPHVHKYQLETVDPTCEKDGFMRYICSCGDIYSSVKMDKTDHRWKAASCAAPKTCTKCGKTEGAALPHTWTEATYAKPKTCLKCYATEGEPLAKPQVIVNETFPKVYYYYSRSFTVNSCEVSVEPSKFDETECYVKINMSVTRDRDSTPTDGKLSFRVNIYDDSGVLVQQDSIWSDKLSHNETGIMTASIPLPKNSQSGSYTLSFEYSY